MKWGTHSLHSVQRRLEIDCYHIVEVGISDIENRPGESAAGIVDPDIDSSELFERRIAEVVYRLRVA
jgi:hypothetical protein